MRKAAKVGYSSGMLHEIRSAAGRLGLSEGTLLALARETAHDGRLRSVEALLSRDQAQLSMLLQWITAEDAILLTTRFRSSLVVRVPLRQFAA